MEQSGASIQTVVPGEASESDEEDAIPAPSKATNVVATVVAGEASESEEEEINTDHGLPPLKVDTEGKGDKDDFTNGGIPESPTTPTFKSHDVKPKYDTLLHRKLRERNVALRRHIVDTVHQSYKSATKDLYNTTQQLHKSQTVILDVSHHMRLLTNDLFHLEDKIDIITSCNILPDISIPVSQGS